ncbi:MAG TPA: aromatic ring-hydroxylating dioxygenase subunit alpha [Candidatus Binatia bacterium]
MEGQTEIAEPSRNEADDLPLLGFRNYWYPAIGSRQVDKAPVAVRVLGDEIVLFRAEAKVSALADRCPHRGTKLSRGRIIFPGTLSCGYHGWTFNAQGECVGAIVEGPEALGPKKVCARVYPTEERFNLIWIYMGEGDPPPLEEDLPPELKEPDLFTFFAFTEWKCNWRYVEDNYPDMLHAFYVHRTSLEVLFNKLPVWGKMKMELLPDKKGIYVQGVGGSMQANYPGLGTFPRRLWWRVLARRSESRTAGADIRMPGYIVLNLRDPYFGVRMANLGWPVPVDENSTRHLNFIVTYPKNIIHKSLLTAWYHAYFWPMHRRFLFQDRRLLEVQDRSRETLSASDVGVINWRRLAPKIARQARSLASPAVNGAEEKSSDQGTALGGSERL